MKLWIDFIGHNLNGKYCATEDEITNEQAFVCLIIIKFSNVRPEEDLQILPNH